MALAEATPAWTPEDDFGVRLAALRVWLARRAGDRRAWNISKAAAYCGLDDGSWANWEAGKGCTDYESVCKKIAHATGCDLDWLMRGGPLDKSRCLMSSGLVSAVPTSFGEMQLFDPDSDVPEPFVPVLVGSAT